MPDAEKAPAPPKGLIVKTAFTDHRTDDHIDDPKAIAAIWASDLRQRVAAWDGGESLRVDREALAKLQASAADKPSDPVSESIVT